LSIVALLNRRQGRYLLAQEVTRVNDVEGVSAERDLHTVEQIEEELIRNDWPTPSGIELDGSVNSSDKEEDGINDQANEHDADILLDGGTSGALLVKSIRAGIGGASDLSHGSIEMVAQNELETQKGVYG